MASRITTVGDSRIIYDPAAVNPVSERLFDPGAWPDAVVVPAQSGGRGKTVFIPMGDHECALRHYHRGGMIGIVLSDTYFWTGAERTRPFCEWMLLQRMLEMNLPVPRPVAARFIRRGLLYSGDLITVRIPGAEPFSRRWTAARLKPDLWRKTGELVGRFHGRRIFHADLNADNIQIDDHDRLFLLDFDRGRIMPRAGPWMQRNLARLKRSLEKISRTSGCDFGDEDWHRFLAGYDSASNKSV